MKEGFLSRRLNRYLNQLHSTASRRLWFRLPSTIVDDVEDIALDDWRELDLDDRAPALSVAMVDQRGEDFVALIVDPVAGRLRWSIVAPRSRLCELHEGMLEDRTRGTVVVSLPLGGLSLGVGTRDGKRCVTIVPPYGHTRRDQTPSLQVVHDPNADPTSHPAPDGTEAEPDGDPATQPGPKTNAVPSPDPGGGPPGVMRVARILASTHEAACSKSAALSRRRVRALRSTLAAVMMPFA